MGNYWVHVKYAKDIFYINKMYRKKACFLQPEQQQEVFPFCKNVNETVLVSKENHVQTKITRLIQLFSSDNIEISNW